MATPIKLKRHRTESRGDEQEYCQVMFKNGPCGGKLEGDMFCDRGTGYPWYIDRQPTACPHCRHALSWTGNCVHERGGCWDRYESDGPGDSYEEQSGHWVNTGEKQGMLTKAQNQERFKGLVDGKARIHARLEEVPF